MRVKKHKTISFAMFLTAAILFANGHAATGTKIHDIRSGRHKGYTRLVLDAEGARPLEIGPATADGVIIVYKQLELTRPSPELFRNMKGAATSVNHHRQADRSVISIRFKNPNTRIKYFYLGKKSTAEGPYRLIMDLYPAGSAAAGPGFLVPVTSAKSVMPVPTLAPAPAAVPSLKAAAEAAEINLPTAESFRQVEANLPKVLKTESVPQTVRSETPAGEPKQWLNRAEPTAKVRMEGKSENLWNPVSPEKTSQAGSTESPSIRNQFQRLKDKSPVLSKVDVPTASKPAHILSAQPPQSGIKSVMPGQAVALQKKSVKPNHESIGLIELILKFLSIALSCFVVLFLHKANKMATNRYDDIIELKHIVKTRPPNQRPPAELGV